MSEPPGGRGAPALRRLPPWQRSDLDAHASRLDEAFRQAGASLAYVFGSLARGREADRKAISDLDIAVVFPPETPRETMRRAWYELRAALERIFGREDFDLVIANEASAALRYRIIRDRDLIYSAGEDELARFESQARRDWLDMAYFRAIQRKALEQRYGGDKR